MAGTPGALSHEVGRGEPQTTRESRTGHMADPRRRHHRRGRATVRLRTQRPRDRGSTPASRAGRGDPTQHQAAGRGGAPSTKQRRRTTARPRSLARGGAVIGANGDAAEQRGDTTMERVELIKARSTRMGRPRCGLALTPVPFLSGLIRTRRCRRARSRLGRLGPHAATRRRCVGCEVVAEQLNLWTTCTLARHRPARRKIRRVPGCSRRLTECSGQGRAPRPASDP